MRHLKFLLMAGVAGAALGLPPAFATPAPILITPNGSVGFVSIGGSVTYVPTASILASATSITIPANDFVNNNPATYLSGPNVFTSLGSGVGVAATLGGGGSFTINDSATPPGGVIFSFGPSDDYTFTASSELWNSDAATDSLSIYFSGTFTDASDTYLPEPASLSFALTQTGGATGSVNWSGTFATPPAPLAPVGVPEPASIALLAAGMVGLAFARRRPI